MTTLRTSPDILILAFLSERVQATALAIQAACRMTPGEVRSRLAHLERRKLVTGKPNDAMPRRRVYAVTNECRGR